MIELTFAPDPWNASSKSAIICAPKSACICFTLTKKTTTGFKLLFKMVLTEKIMTESDASKRLFLLTKIHLDDNANNNATSDTQLQLYNQRSFKNYFSFQ